MRVIFSLFLLSFLVAWQQPLSNGEDPSFAKRLSYIDENVKPGEDFFLYANGTWMAETEIPADKPFAGGMFELFDSNQEILKRELEKSIASNTLEEGSDEYKAALFYQVGMDSLKAEKVGYAPLKPWFNKIDKIKNIQQLNAMMVELHLHSFSSLYGVYVSEDARNNKVNAMHLTQSGLSLPDRDYYLNEDERSAGIREAFLGHVSKMMEMTGQDAKEARMMAEEVLTFETMLASASVPRVELRDPIKTYNKMGVTELTELCGAIAWQAYFNGLGIEELDSVIVSTPSYFEQLPNILMKDANFNMWRSYLKYKVIKSMANYLSHDFVQESFTFYSQTLNGTPAMQDRWKRVLSQTDAYVGEPLGKLYVKVAFPPEAKELMMEMVGNVRTALGTRIENLTWMSDDTKKEALVKLEAMTTKIGYPDEWDDYSDLQVSDESFANNIMNARVFSKRKNLDEYGQEPDPNDWPLTPPTVNAGYSPIENMIIFPAGILQPPFFDMNGDLASNYGSAASIIGHEITHGFDDSGRRYDAEGNLRDWWTEEDDARFKERAQVMIDQFNGYEVLDSVFVNGQLTLGENIADLGGMLIAYDALMIHQEKHGKEPVIDGYTPEQRFFLAFAQNWRTKFREQIVRQRILTDVHAPGKFRVLGPLSNCESFFEAYEVKPGEAMRRTEEDIVRIW